MILSVVRIPLSKTALVAVKAAVLIMRSAAVIPRDRCVVFNRVHTARRKHTLIRPAAARAGRYLHTIHIFILVCVCLCVCLSLCVLSGQLPVRVGPRLHTAILIILIHSLSPSLIISIGMTASYALYEL